MRQANCWLAVALASAAIPTLPAQTPMPPAAATPHVTGTVKSTNATGLTLTTATGEVYTVTVPATAKVLVVAPGSKDLKSATNGSLANVAPADKVLITGAAGDAGTTLTAVRIILMKSQAIADTHAAEDAAWAQGGGGIVRSVNAGAGQIVVANGLKTLTVTTTPATIVRRYSGDSVRFQDAQASTLAAVRPGDQLRVRGTKTADGSSIVADELVTGSFHNYSGLIASIDARAGTVTLKDLATKKTVTVAITANSDVRRIPAALAQRVAMGMKGGPASGQAAAAAPATAPPGDAATSTRRAGMDLSQMLSRLPTETLGGLKNGDAVMIVATSPAADAGQSTAVTLLTGVDAILSASPAGQTTTLSPWGLGGNEGGDAGGMQGGSSQRVATPQ